MAGARLLVGVIAGAHGVRGLVKLHSFTETPEDIAAYGPLSDEAGARRFTLRLTGRGKDVLLARVAGVETRDQAEALEGTRLFVERAALPPIAEAETYYRADLIGLAVEDPQGRRLGRVADVENHGAGDILAVGLEAGGELLLPFTRAAVPLVDIAGGRLVVEPPAELTAAPATPAEAAPDGAPDA